nr:ATP-binding protein [uncultured Actinoplanes sp.]
MSVECTVRDKGGSVIVALTGRLRLPDVAPVQLQLNKCLAEQPDAVLVDLSRMTVGEPLALSVFVAVGRQAALWPGTPVLLCAADGPTRGLLSGIAFHRVPLFRTVRAACEHARASRRIRPTLRDEILPLPGAPRFARNLATEACLRWELPHLVAPASLITSELVSNVVDHANTMATLAFSLHRRHLTISVRDGSLAEPVPPSDQPLPPRVMSGRGLMIVQATADSWGWLPAESGKVVWATLSR